MHSLSPTEATRAYRAEVTQALNARVRFQRAKMSGDPQEIEVSRQILELHQSLRDDAFNEFAAALSVREAPRPCF
jgi:hypothetical protein